MGSATARRRDLRLAAALTLICAAGAVLRFAWLGDESFWLDEMYTANLVTGAEGMRDILAGSLPGDVHPPLYYFLLKGWSAAFGTDEFGLRSFSAAIGSLTAPAGLWFMRRHLGPRGLVALAVLFTVSPALLEASQQARMYPLLLLGSTVAGALLLDLTVPGTWNAAARRSLAWLTALLVALCAVHYFSLLVAMAAGLVLLWRWRGERRAERAILIAGGAGLACVLLWLVPHALQRPERLGLEGDWLARLPFNSLGALVYDLFGSPPTVTAICAFALAGAAALVRWRGIGPTDAMRLRALAGFAMAMLGLAMVASLFAPVVNARTVVVIAPPLLMFVACALPHGPGGTSRWRRLAFASLLALAVLGPAVDGLQHLQNKKFPQWRESARLVVAWQGCRTAPIVTSGGWDAIGYYIRRFAPQARIDLHEWSRMGAAGDYRDIDLSADCPVLWWGIGSGLAGHFADIVQERHGTFRTIRFYRVFLVVREGTELPAGFAESGISIN